MNIIDEWAVADAVREIYLYGISTAEGHRLDDEDGEHLRLVLDELVRITTWEGQRIIDFLQRGGEESPRVAAARLIDATEADHHLAKWSKHG